MTLFKQLALVVSLIIVTMLGAVMYINYNSAKEDMVKGLYESTVNNISSLSSNLADAGSDEALLQTTIDSEFDSGYFKSIEFTSNDGQFHYKQVDNEPIEGVPLWFVNFTDIELDPITSDVSFGWSIIGEVTVTGDTNVVYTALYDVLIKLLYLFSISVFIALIILNTLLHFVTKPLNLIQEQAEAIMRDEFVIQKSIPYTTEFKNVVNGMNQMVKKVEALFDKANTYATKNRELLYNDPTTKLFNRRYLDLKFQDIMHLENKTNGGSAVFIALSGAEIINQTLGRRSADELFVDIASIFMQNCEHIEDSLVARVNGTEFTMMLPDCDTTRAQNILEQINDEFTMLMISKALDISNVFLSIGIYRYAPHIAKSELFTRTDSALSNAKASESSNIYTYEEKDNENAMGKEQWRSIIEDSIDKQLFNLKFYATMDTRTKKVNHKVMTFTIDGGEDKRYYYGDFIAPAINLGLVSKIYIVALKDLITKQHNDLDGSLCSIRLSNEFLKDTDSFDELAHILEMHHKDINFKLFFEVSDSFAINNTKIVKRFVNLFKKYDFHFGINSFTGEANDLSYLKEIPPQFIKVDAAYLLDQTEASMHSLQLITGSLNINIIATFVKTKEEVEQLTKLDIHHIQGPVTDSL